MNCMWIMNGVWDIWLKPYHKNIYACLSLKWWKVEWLIMSVTNKSSFEVYWFKEQYWLYLATVLENNFYFYSFLYFNLIENRPLKLFFIFEILNKILFFVFSKDVFKNYSKKMIPEDLLYLGCESLRALLGPWAFWWWWGEAHGVDW